MTQSVPVGEIRSLGDRALLIGVPDAVAARRVARALNAADAPGVREVVGGMATVMVELDPEGDDPDTLRPLLTTLMAAPLAPSEVEDAVGDLTTVPCVFDGPDLHEVATLAGCSPDEVVALLTSRPLAVAVVGFSPGFAFLGGLPEPLRHIPRRSRPRPVVPAGSVALANGHAAVYPTASPGGWQLIGRTGESLFTPDVPPYARLAPGHRVQFTIGAEEEIVERSMSAGRAWSPPATARTVFEVAQPGLRTVLQDGGRRGLAAIGVPAAGPADPHSFSLANLLVGNPPGACTLEVTARGPTLRGIAPTHVAVVGGCPDLHLQGQPVPADQVIPVNAGQILEVGLLRCGLRTYVAVAGGFIGPAVLGSSASDQLCGLGPGPVAAGDHLAAGTVHPPLGDHLRADALPERTQDAPVVLRVVPGPHAEWFAPGAMETLASMRFHVESESNRVGVRLHVDGVAPALRKAQGAASELDSQGVVTGAVQVPPEGDPVILLSDHATLGGYPVVAVVATVDHGLLGQCAPGASVLLVPIDHGEARRALEERRRSIATAVRGHYPLAIE